MVSVAIDLVERILDGDIGAMICALIPFAFVIWFLTRIYILPARKWKTPATPTERTYFYRKKQAEEEKGPPESMP